jgi:hypothetical protein
MAFNQLAAGLNPARQLSQKGLARPSASLGTVRFLQKTPLIAGR